MLKRSACLLALISIVFSLPSTALAAKKTPQAVLASSSLSFPPTAVGSTSAPQTVTLTNSSSTTLKISGITLTGAGASTFAETNTCDSKLAKNAKCTISATFTPSAAASYEATITVADNATGSPQTVTLTGSGTTTSATALTLITVPEADLSVTPIYNFINTATSTLDMTMYELVDTTLQQDLAALAKKGVKVRVILDQALEKDSNAAAFTYLNANGVQAVWANSAFHASHQKTITIDGKTSAIMTLNLVTKDYSSTRDFAVIDTSANDVAAIETTFNADFTAASITPPLGDDLIWSPTNAKPALLSLIGSAKSSLNIENEEMGDTGIVAAFATAAKSGVQVQVTMTNSGTYTSEFNTLKAAGVKISTYTATAALYIHAKVIVVDYGKTGQQAFVGSENFSTPSLTENRELGLTLTDAAILQSLNTTLNSDFAGGTAF
jgi:cardiolipin synthase